MFVNSGDGVILLQNDDIVLDDGYYFVVPYDRHGCSFANGLEFELTPGNLTESCSSFLLEMFNIIFPLK